MLSSLHKCKSISVHFIYSNRVHLALSYGTFLFIAAVSVKLWRVMHCWLLMVHKHYLVIL